MNDLRKKMLQHIGEIEAHLYTIQRLSQSDASVEYYTGYSLAKFAAKLDQDMHLLIADTRHYSDEQPLANEILDEMNV